MNVRFYLQPEFYVKMFGGKCEYYYNVKLLEHHIHIDNDDIGYLHLIFNPIHDKLTDQQLFDLITDMYLDDMSLKKKFNHCKQVKGD